jgi:RNA polymerase sigma-70 factor (ECF subfamily)
MGDDANRIDLTQVVADYHQDVYRYAYRLTGSAPDAEDLTQQVFLTAQECLGQLRDPENIRSWLFTVLRNSFFRSRKRRRPVAAGDLDLNIDSIPDEVPSSEAIDREQLQQALSELPPPYRIVVLMYYFEDCSYREIAEKLDLPIGTVMSRLARAKAALRTSLFGSESRQASPQRPTAISRGLSDGPSY